MARVIVKKSKKDIPSFAFCFFKFSHAKIEMLNSYFI